MLGVAAHPLRAAGLYSAQLERFFLHLHQAPLLLLSGPSEITCSTADGADSVLLAPDASGRDQEQALAFK